MQKRVQHDNQKPVIPNLFRNLEFQNVKWSIAFVLVFLLFFSFFLQFLPVELSFQTADLIQDEDTVEMINFMLER